MSRIKKIVLSLLAGICGVTLSAGSAAAYDASARGHITLVEADAGARFIFDTDVGGCPAGSWLTMSSAVASPEKVRNAQSVILAAFMARKEIRIYVFSDSCQVEFMHLL